MKILYILLFLPIFLSAQDAYHTELLNQLSGEYNINSSEYIFSDNEADIIGDINFYGNLSRQNVAAEGFNFTRKLIVKVNSPGANVWDAGAVIRNNIAIQNGDVCLVAFWARRISASAEVYFFVENSSNFEKEIYSPLSLTQDWTQYFVAFKSSKTFNANTLSFGYHLASQTQEFELAGYTALNLGSDIQLSDVPSIFDPSNYGGHEEDAPWRDLAAERIEQIRKANLEVIVRDQQGNLVENAAIKVEMQKHSFGFGSAFVGCRFPGNDCYNQTYIDKLLDLDGQGHGFNVGVTENALKWDAWEEEWIGSPDETINAIQWLTDKGIKMRGHTLVWPGWSNMPDDMFENRTDLTYLTNRLNSRLGTMLTNPQLSQLVTEWDILNEITVNRSLEQAFSGTSGYPTGREIYLDIFEKAKQFAPNNLNYINDYVTLSNGGFGGNVTATYKSFIQEIIDGGAQVDGIGFQCHIGTTPTSILKVEEVLNDFYNSFGTRLKITEFDLDDKIGDETEAKYMTDFLTMIFSHPAMDAFLMWGFWDGNHWKQNAPMFDINWNLKASGKAFNDLVFGEWWTNENGSSDSDGRLDLRAFKGDYKITVTIDGQDYVQYHSIEEDRTVLIDLSTTSTKSIDELNMNILPNPSSGQIVITFDSNGAKNSLTIYNLAGQARFNKENLTSGEMIITALSSGIYVAKIQNEFGQTSIQKLMIGNK